MVHKGTCKQCGNNWNPTLYHLTIMPHEVDRPCSGVQNARTSYCPECSPKRVELGLVELNARIEAEKCPGPLLWNRV